MFLTSKKIFSLNTNKIQRNQGTVSDSLHAVLVIDDIAWSSADSSGDSNHTKIL